MKSTSIQSPFVTQWSFIDDLLMTIDNKNNIYIVAPHEITNAWFEGEKLRVTAVQPVSGPIDAQRYSFALHSSAAFPSVAQKAEKAGLPVAQFAASKIKQSKAEAQQESDRYEQLRKSCDTAETKSRADTALSVERNLVSLVFPLMAVGLFAAMVHFGHGRKPEDHTPAANHNASAASRPVLKQKQQTSGIIPN